MSKKMDKKLRPQDWLPYFEAAGLLKVEPGECTSSHSKAIKMGQFLSPMVGRECPIQVGDRIGKAVLRVELDRSKTKWYFFGVTWDVGENETKNEVKSAKKKGKKFKGKGDDASNIRVEPKAPRKENQTKSGGAKASGKKFTSSSKRTGKNAVGNEENWE